MKLLQLNTTSLNTSKKALFVYQDLNNYNAIFLQETDHKEDKVSFRNFKTRVHTIHKNKTQGYGVGTFIREDTKNIFRDDMITNKLECIWNELYINKKPVLIVL